MALNVFLHFCRYECQTNRALSPYHLNWNAIEGLMITDGASARIRDAWTEYKLLHHTKSRSRRKRKST